MDFGEFRTYCLSKKGVTEDYPFEGTHAWMKVVGKLFAISNLDAVEFKGELMPSFYFINLKCDPEKAVELREEYSFVKPGYHMNKKHWNSVYTEGVEETFLKEMIDQSYDLVVKKLTKKDRDLLANSE